MDRTYVTAKNFYDDQESEPATVTGLVYGFDKHSSLYLQENLHIEEINHEDGRWHLILERSEWISDDLEKLERLLMDWARDEQYETGEYVFRPLPADATPAPIESLTA